MTKADKARIADLQSKREAAERLEKQEIWLTRVRVRAGELAAKRLDDAA